jgi:excinuclease UvrABC ATPase subunit
VDISQEEGEPVLCAAAVKDIQEVKEISDHWFARGGKELRVLHYNSRDSEGREVGLLYNFWSCPQCSRSLPKAPRALEQDSPACAGCRGEGWILDKGGDDAQRWVACRDCDALGFRTEFSSYCFYGLKLWQVLVLSFIEFRELVIKDSPDHEIVSLLSQVCAAELGDCPMGAVYDLCSPGERMLVTVAQLRLARLEDVRCLLDGAYGDLSVLPSTGGSVSALSVMRSGVEPQRATLPHFKVPKDASRIVIRDVNHGALHIDAVTFPQGAVTAICGPAGVGKSLFLQIVKKRFSQRRKRAHVASFGDLQRCWFVEGGCERTGTLLSVLDFAHDLAREISRTRRAKELGILADDLELPRSKYRCERCLGGELSEAETVCSSCQGALYDWRVAELPLLGVTVREILQAPLFQVATKLWSDSSAEALFRVLVDLGVGDLSLGFQARVVSPALRRTLKLCAMLARVGSLGPSERVKSGPQDLANQLVLLDGPRILPGEYEEIIAKLLYTLSQRGATILYASPPEGLESCCQSVVRLGWSSRDAAHRAASRYLDQRFARGSGIAV